MAQKKVKVTKKQIKEDSFVTATINAWEYIKEHENQFFIILVIILVIAAGGGWFTHAKRVNREKAITQFSEGLFAFQHGDIKTAEELFKDNVKNYGGGIREAAYSQYFLALCALEDGRNTEAIDRFRKYTNEMSHKFPYYHDAALDGIATALENERRYKEAADVYLKLLKNMKTNKFYEDYYMRKAADDLKLSSRIDEAIAILKKLHEKAKGLDRRNIEVELEILEAQKG